MQSMEPSKWPRVLAIGGLVIILITFLADVPLQFALANTAPLTNAESYGGSGGGAFPNVLFALSMLLLAPLAALIVVRQPRNPVGWLLFGAIVCVGVTSLIGDYGAYAIQISHGTLPGGVFAVGITAYSWLPFVAMLLVLPLQVFPDGHLLSPRWRWLMWVSSAAVILGTVGNTFGPDSGQLSSFPQLRTGLLSTAFGASRFALPFLGICGLLGLVSLVLRYRRSSSEIRHQIRWLLFAGLLYVIPFTVFIVVLETTQVSLTPLAGISVIGLVAVPFAMAIAVLRYRLYDIDIIISRSLVYGSLAVLISAVYVGIAVGIGALIGGGGKPNLWLSILATAIVAVGFAPVRERLQRIANRLVYGRRATPYEVLAAFSERVSETYGVDEVMPRMARLLAEGTGAQRAEVWLRAERTLRVAASWPPDAPKPDPVPLSGAALPDIPGIDLIVPVRHQEDLLGALSISKRGGESVSPVDRNLLVHLADQAGLMLKNAGLTADLQARLVELRASRQRLVAAQDEERRRIERNLHDGAQQHLVALKVKLGLTAMLLAKDPAQARASIGELKADADDALETLRDLARGIYPPLLADRGLATALESQARKATLPVDVKADHIGRYPQEIEAGVYFCVLEALQNVQKYAEATRATVTLGQSDGTLTVSVSDDGRGFDTATTRRGSGLINMADRIDALGGELAVQSAPGEGTHLRVALPAGEAVPMLASALA
jgi:signal transduction histidine kinase